MKQIQVNHRLSASPPLDDFEVVIGDPGGSGFGFRAVLSYGEAQRLNSELIAALVRSDLRMQSDEEREAFDRGDFH